MKTACTILVIFVVGAAATACSGQREVATTAATPSATDAPIPDTA